MKLQECFKWRNVWMGIAIIWIIFFHINVNCPTKILSILKDIGYGGVDIFIFASGIGCFYSLKRNGIRLFYRRRFIKIMPLYWIVLFLWCIFRYYENKLTFQQIVGNVCCVQSIIDNEAAFNWYMSGIWIMYILAPLLYYMTSNKHFKIILLILLISTILFWNVDDWIIIVTRIPIFFVGMKFADVANKEYILKKVKLYYPYVSC